MAFFGDDLNFDIGGGEDLEDGSDDSASYEYGGTEARVFLVDAHRRMFEKAPRHDEDDGAEESSSSRSPFVDVINAILISIRRRVFTSNASLYAFVSYGTKEKKEFLRFQRRLRASRLKSHRSTAHSYARGNDRVRGSTVL